MADVAKEARAPGSLLLVRLGAVGDVIRTLPLLHALRADHPGIRIGWVVEEASAGLLQAMPGLDAVHVLPRRSIARDLRRPGSWLSAWRRWREFRNGLRAAGYELVLDVHGTMKAALVARSALARSAAGLPSPARLVGFGPGGSKEGAHLLYDEVLPFPGGPLTRISRALLLGRSASLLSASAPDGSEQGSAVEFGLQFPAKLAQGPRGFLRGLAQPVVVLFPFASATAKGRRKRWPVPRWAELSRGLAAAGASVVVAWGSPREGEEAAAIVDAAAGLGAGTVALLAPPTDLVELAGLLEEAQLLITGDTGPMHLAAAVGTRCLALFGPSDPIVNRPHGEGHEVLVHQPLEGLEVARVQAAAVALLASSLRVTGKRS